MTRKHRSIAVLMTAAVLVAACSDQELPLSPTDHALMGHNARGDAEIGFTDGWRDGRTVQFFYNKPFFCKSPPESGASSSCEAGEDAATPPRSGAIPALYVMTPIGFRPAESTLQCPVVGACINHPSTIDLSRLFGAGTENLPLPAHSHIVEKGGAQAGWWNIEVVGVTDPAVWDQVVAGKSLERVRELQAAGEGITGDIATNLFLFFSVRP